MAMHGKSFFFRKDLASLFSLLGFVFLIVFFIGYLCSGRTNFNPEYSASLIVVSAFSLVWNLFFVLMESKIGRYLAFDLTIFLLMEYVHTQITYVSNIFVGIDGTSFSFGFLLTFISILFSLVLNLLSGIKSKDEETILLGEQSL